MQGSTSLSLRATAGLRLLPGSKADDILKAVRTYLASFPFNVKPGGREPQQAQVAAAGTGGSSPVCAVLCASSPSSFGEQSTRRQSPHKDAP